VTPLTKLLPRGSDFPLRSLRQDVLAGLTVAVVALPLALGFGITAGVGAAAGITTAIIAGFVAAVFGGSSFQVSGPTGAMTVVLLPIVAAYGPESLLVVGIGAGVVLLILSVLGVGKFVTFIPWPVVAGFTTGIGVIIFLQQVPAFLGVEKGSGESIIQVTFNTLRSAGSRIDGPTVIIAVVTIATMVGWRRIPKWDAMPASMVALLVGTGVSLLPMFEGIGRVVGVPRGISLPARPVIELGMATDLFRAILAVAVLAALESLLSAVVADGMTIDERHDPDRELFGQGLANVASAIFGGMPATGALARTAVNVRSGARSRWSSMIHSVVLLVIVLFLAPLAMRIPLAVLAGILMVVAIRMIEFEAFRTIFRSTRSDTTVLLLTLAVTVMFDLIVAIEVGMVAAGILFIARVSRLFSVDITPLSSDRGAAQDTASEQAAERQLLARHIVAYRIDGPVFFGAASRFMDQLLKVDSQLKVVILRMRMVPVMDATGAAALESIVERMAHRKIVVLISGLQGQPFELLERSGLLDKVSRNRDHLFATTQEAIAHAYLHLEGADHTLPANAAKNPEAPTDQ